MPTVFNISLFPSWNGLKVTLLKFEARRGKLLTSRLILIPNLENHCNKVLLLIISSASLVFWYVLLISLLESGSINLEKTSWQASPKLYIPRISSIFDKCSSLKQTIWLSKVYFNEFVANALRDNMGMIIFNLWGCGGF